MLWLLKRTQDVRNTPCSQANCKEEPYALKLAAAIRLKMADTLSGLILVMLANGLCMLEAPKMVREQIVDPLNGRSFRSRGFGE